MGRFSFASRSGDVAPSSVDCLAGVLGASGKALPRVGEVMRSNKEYKPPPDFQLLPIHEGEISLANLQKVREIAEPILPALRELRRLNWEIRLVKS